MLNQMRCALCPSLVVLLTALSVGCATDGGNKERWRTDAQKRWLQMRSELMLQMAQQAFDTGDLTKAERDLKNAISFDPENKDLHVLAGRIALEQGRLEKAFLHLNNAIELDNPERPRSAEARYYQGVVLQRWQRYADALERYEEAYQIRPDHPPFLTARCEMLVALDRVNEAVQLLESKLNYFDQSAGIRATLGHMYRLVGDHAKAADVFMQASVLDPEDLSIQEEHARALVAADQHQEAIKVLVRLIEHEESKDRKDLRRLLAQSHIQVGQLAQARKVYTDVTRGGGENAEDWIQLAQIAWQSDDLGATLSASNRAMRAAPQRHEGYLLAGMVWQKRGRLENALRNFDRAAELAPDNAVPLILRGISLQKAGRNAAAAKAYVEALRRKPDDPRATKLLRTVRSRQR